MLWPAPTDYQEAIQAPWICFFDPELKQGAVETDRLGLPRPISGNFAVVFPFVSGGRKWAVRCFSTYHPDREQRYAAISKHLEANSLPYMVDFRFLEKGIRVKGRWYPILKMEWVDGTPLNDYLEENLGKPQVLQNLAREFASVVADLGRCSIAHGDLQHGNILVAERKLRLIDYDGMYVPALDGLVSHELGHRNYQHPDRSARDFGPFLDNFSAWVIYLSIAALIADPSLWRRTRAGDEQLLFGSGDLSAPHSSRAMLSLRQHHNSATQAIPAFLESLIGLPLEQVPALDTENASIYSIPQPDVTARAAVLPTWLADHVATGFPGKRPTDSQPTRVPSPGTGWIADLMNPPLPKSIRASPRFERIAIAIWVLQGAILASLYLAGMLPLFGPILVSLGSLVVLVGIFDLRYSMLPEVKQKRALGRQHRKKMAEVNRITKTIARLDKQDKEQRSKRDAELAESLRNLQAQFMADQLKGYRLASAQISGIGPTLTHRLEMAGVRSAIDVTWQRVYGVYGIGPARASALLAWRAAVESQVRVRMPARLPRHLEEGILKKYTLKAEELRKRLAQANAKRDASESAAALLDLELRAYEQITFAKHLRRVIPL